MRHDFDMLKKMGAKRVELTTRVNNERALKLYKRMGMTESSYVDGFVYLRKDL